MTEKTTNPNPDTQDGSYDADQITVLPGLEAVRVRPDMYIGSRDAQGLHHLIWEVVDNSIDEALAGHATEIEVELTADGGCRVTDNGRGIPVDEHEQTGTSALTTVLTTLHAGGKFDDNGGAYQVSGGLHGVGVSVVNALSHKFQATVWRNNQTWQQTFRKGEPDTPEPVTVGTSRRTGTEILFWPDPTIFTETVVFNTQQVEQRLRELSFLNQGLKILYTDSRNPDHKTRTFQHEGGIIDYVKWLTQTKTLLHPEVAYFTDRTDQTGTEIAVMWTTGYNEQILSFANNIRNPSGGTHEEGFRSGCTKAVNDVARDKRLIKKAGQNLAGTDIREGLVAVISVKLPNPQFEGQTKSKLVNPETRSQVLKTVNQKFGEWLTKHTKETRLIVKKAQQAQNAREAAQRARNLIRRKTALDTMRLPGKLVDCSSRDPSESELFIVEGDSAAGPAKSGRDAKRQAVLPIRGKIVNVEKVRLGKALKNNEIQALATALGTGLGDKFDINKARYHKIVLLTDADVDGGHIRVLLLTFFLRYMKPLLEAGYVYVAVPPLYRVKVGKQIRYLSDENELTQFRKKHPKTRPTRFKGLGEMNVNELTETSLDPQTRKLQKIQVHDIDQLDQLCGTLMGSDVPARREWIRQEAADMDPRFLDI